MPKMKTHRGTAKRFRVTGSGKIMRAKAFKSHIMTKKSQKRKRNFRHETEISKADQKEMCIRDRRTTLQGARSPTGRKRLPRTRTSKRWR